MADIKTPEDKIPSQSENALMLESSLTRRDKKQARSIISGCLGLACGLLITFTVAVYVSLGIIGRDITKPWGILIVFILPAAVIATAFLLHRSQFAVGFLIGFALVAFIFGLCVSSVA